jgi:hypothetical protein
VWPDWAFLPSRPKGLGVAVECGTGWGELSSALPALPGETVYGEGWLAPASLWALALGSEQFPFAGDSSERVLVAVSPAPGLRPEQMK